MSTADEASNRKAEEREQRTRNRIFAAELRRRVAAMTATDFAVLCGDLDRAFDHTEATTVLLSALGVEAPDA